MLSESMKKSYDTVLDIPLQQYYPTRTRFQSSMTTEKALADAVLRKKALKSPFDFSILSGFSGIRDLLNVGFFEQRPESARSKNIHNIIS